MPSTSLTFLAADFPLPEFTLTERVERAWSNDSGLSFLPDTLVFLRSLTSLHANGNQFDDLPYDFGDLSELTDLRWVILIGHLFFFFFFFSL